MPSKFTSLPPNNKLDEFKTYNNPWIKNIAKEINKKVEFVLNNALKEHELYMLDANKIQAECKIILSPDGTETLYHLDKPLLKMYPIEINSVLLPDNDNVTISVSQKFEKIRSR